MARTKMNATLNMIVSMYEADPGGEETVQGLAQTLGYDPAVLKAVLAGHSTVYRAKQDMLAVGIGAKNPDGSVEHPAEDIPDDIFAQVKQVVIDTALTSDDERLRVANAKWLWNEKKKRHDKKDGITVNNVNLTLINQRFAEIAEMKRLKREASMGRGVTVEAQPIST